MSLLIKNGRIITATDDYIADIFIAGTTITSIGTDLHVTADRVVDASGKYVLPGGIDPHTHLDMPFGGTVCTDNFETGTRAAAHGGTTTIVDFAIQSRGHSALEGLETWHEKAAGRAVIDYGFHMILSDVEGDRLDDMVRLEAAGVTSFKLFTAYPGVFFVDDGTLFKVMQRAGERGTMICMHAENGIVIDELIRQAVAEGKTEPKWHALTRPTAMEAEAVHRVAAIAELANSPVYIVHLSSADALEEAARARNLGVEIYAETCPQYLFLDHSFYEQEGFEGAKYVMSPPLREKWNQDELWLGLQTGELQVVATDHAPFRFHDQKSMGRDVFTKIPNGGPGIENRMALIHQGGVVEGRISLNRFVEITSTAAAKLFGMFPQKGTIAVGSDADLVLFNPNRREVLSVNNKVTHNMNVDYCAYEGLAVEGYPETVISRGAFLVDGCKFVGSDGHGQFIKRGLYTPLA